MNNQINISNLKFAPSIYRIVKILNEDFTIDLKSLVFFNKMILMLIRSFLSLYKQVDNFQKTLDRLCGRLHHDILSKVYESLTNFHSNNENNNDDIVQETRSNLSHLYIQVNIIEEYVNFFGYKNYSNEFLISIAAYIEYFAFEILRLCIEKNKTDRIVKKQDIIKVFKDHSKFFNIVPRSFSGSHYWTKTIDLFEFKPSHSRLDIFCRVDKFKIAIVSYDPHKNRSVERLEEYNQKQFPYHSDKYSEIENYTTNEQNQLFLQEYQIDEDIEDKEEDLKSKYQNQLEMFVQSIDSKLDFSPCFINMMNEINDTTGLNIESLVFMNKILAIIIESILRGYRANNDLTKAIRNIFIEDLFNFVMDKALDALNSFHVENEERKELQTQSEKSRLFYSDIDIQVNIVEEYVKLFGYSSYTDEFLIYISAVMDYFISEIIDLSAYDINQHIITKDSIIKAINKDENLLKIMMRCATSERYSDWSDFVENYQPHPSARNFDKICRVGTIVREEFVSYNKKNGKKNIKTKENSFDETISNGFKYLEVETEENLAEREKMMANYADNMASFEEMNRMNEDEENEGESEEEDENDDENDENEESDDEEEDGEEAFIFTKSELEEYVKKAIEDYIASQNLEKNDKKKTKRL